MKVWFPGAALLFTLSAPLSAAPPAAPAISPAPGWAAAALDAGLAAHALGDYPAARGQFDRLAAHNSAIAETMLGTMYAQGQGVSADAATAVGYWYRAANRGYAPAQLAMARARAAGQGIALDSGDAWVWAQLALRHGDATVRRQALALATTLQYDLPPATRAALQRRLDSWRPWPSGPS